MDSQLAEEYIERTVGIAKAKYFTLEQLNEVIQGKVRPQTITQKKKYEQEMLRQKDEIRKIEEIKREQEHKKAMDEEEKRDAIRQQRKQQQLLKLT